MIMFKRSAIALALAVACLAAVQASARAGTFTMRQCVGSSFQDFQGYFAPINGTSLVDSISGCTTTGAGKIGIYQDRSGVDMVYGEGGHFRWDAPAGTRVIATQFTSRLRDANNIKAELIGWNGSSITDLSNGVVHDGNSRVSNWSNPNSPQTLISARLNCMFNPGCANQPSSIKAYMEVTDVAFTVEDITAPTLAASGQLWDWGGDSAYHRGSASVRIDAADQGSGVAAAWAEINGQRVDLAAPLCAGDRGTFATRFTPCPSAHAATRTFDTAAAPFSEGANQIRLCTRDYAATATGAAQTCSASRTLLVDNQAPAAATGLVSMQGETWQPENGFDLRWDIPAGQVAPVIGAVYVLKELDTGQQVNAGFFAGNEIESAGPFEVPEVGAYRMIIYLVDGAANLGQPAETILRFDNRPPGDVSPEPPAGWVSRDELPLEQEIEKAAAGGPSGISGYALAVSDQGPARPCVNTVCLAPEMTLTGGPDLRTGSIGGLVEGSHWISAVAVSGARRASVEAGNTMVQVDRTTPASMISGVPNDWVNHPVTLTVQASDQLSGMQPVAGDDGEPVTVIDADNYATYESPGPFATFAVATEGVNRVRYWAEDLAGNANDGRPAPDGERHPTPGQAVVRIDTTSPEAGFDPARDPEDPEVVTVQVSDADSGVAAATIGIRPAGSAQEFSPLKTTGGDGAYQARVPSDDLPAGAYELGVTAFDRAGNRAVGTQTTAGQPMILNLPLKAPSSLTAVLDKGTISSRVQYGASVWLEGRLTSNGAAVPNQRILVHETYEAGSSQPSSSTELVTDGDGRYRTRLPSGPGRSVAVTFDGTRKLARAGSDRLELKVKGKVRFRLKPKKIRNGGVVRMKGSVGFEGALPPARGKLVAIQYLDPSRRRWRPVEVLRTDQNGRFRYGYRFRTITSAQRIIFRASVLPEAGWPYLPSTSKRKSVIVYPKG